MVGMLLNRNAYFLWLFTLVLLPTSGVQADESISEVPETDLPLIHRDDFESIAAWKPAKDDVWKRVEVDRDGKRNAVFRVTGKSSYKPPVRSPHSIAWLNGKFVGDFVMTVRAENTNPKAGNHRDLCLFWGRQDASHFYYVHFGAKADPHSCQIFIVDGKDRTKITVDEVPGTPWGADGAWHTLRVIRSVDDGMIRVYFDDMKKPHMTAKDTTFAWGEVGIGTFDDSGNFDDFELRGELVKRP